MTTPNTTPEAPPEAPPLFACRACKRAAVRFLPGRRRTFYCDQHGPSILADWSRLLPLPQLPPAYEDAGRVLAQVPPLPPRVARLIEALADGLRAVLADDSALARVSELEHEVARLTEQVRAVSAERDAAEEIAREAMDLWPTPAAPLLEPDARTPTSATFSDAELERERLDVLVRRLPTGPRTPGLSVTRQAVKDFDGCPLKAKRAVLRAFRSLGGETPELLGMESSHAHVGLVGLRATKRLRIVARRANGSYHVQRIVPFNHKAFSDLGR